MPRRGPIRPYDTGGTLVWKTECNRISARPTGFAGQHFAESCCRSAKSRFAVAAEMLVGKATLKLAPRADRGGF